MARGDRGKDWRDELQAKECQRWAAAARVWERPAKSSPGPSDRALSVREDVSIAWKHPACGPWLPQPQETSPHVLLKDTKVITKRTLEKGGRVGCCLWEVGQRGKRSNARATIFH